MPFYCLIVVLVVVVVIILKHLYSAIESGDTEVLMGAQVD